MADTAQLDATDNVKLPQAGDKSALPQVAGNSEHSKTNEKPASSEQSDKTESVDASGKDRKKKILKVLAYAGAGLVALTLIKFFFFTPPEAEITQVTQQDYVGEVQSTGTVNVDVLAAIGAKIPGRIERILVDEGDFVHSGQVVATLEDTDIREVLDRSEARLQEARLTEQAARATEQSTRARALSAQAVVQARGATTYQVGRSWEREKHLVATGAVSQEEADLYEERDRTAESALHAAEAEFGAAKAQIEAAGAKTQAAHSDIAAADAEVRLQ